MTEACIHKKKKMGLAKEGRTLGNGIVMVQGSENCLDDFPKKIPEHKLGGKKVRRET